MRVHSSRRITSHRFSAAISMGDLFVAFGLRGAIMSRRVFAEVLFVCALAFALMSSTNVHAQTAAASSGDCWINSAAGESVASLSIILFWAPT
jgi:hypothetical protein